MLPNRGCPDLAKGSRLAFWPMLESMTTTINSTHAVWPYPFWIAHRGAGKLAPENTLTAFRLGAAHGFGMFECDVTLSADAEPFLLHDPHLSRTTNGKGLAVEQSWADLSMLDAGAWHSAPFAGEPLLRLDALATWLLANQLLVNLEIKPAPGDEVRCGEVVANEVARLWLGAPAWPLLSSFKPEALRAAQTVQPDLPRALLLESWLPDWREQASDLACVAIVVNQAHLDAVRIAQAHSHGLKVLTYTVNDTTRARDLMAAGLDGLITDKVDLFEAQARRAAKSGQ